MLVYTPEYQYNYLLANETTDANNFNRYRIYFPVDFDTLTKHKNITNDGYNYDDTVASTTYMLTHKGNKGHDSPNQDCSIVIHDYKKNKKQTDWFLAALFDGHGDLGHVTSHVAVTDLPLLLLQSIQKIDNRTRTTTSAMIPQIIEDVFHTIDTGGIIAKVPRGGATAVIALQFQRTIFMASVGDSTAYLIQWFVSNVDDAKTATTATNTKPLPYSIIKSAIQHKPGNPVERKRIEDNGGHVYIPPVNSGESSRVIYKSYDSNSGKTVQTGLAMSRSLGDTTAKELKVVISTPDIISFEMPPTPHNDNFFIILASDGIIDVTNINDIIIPIGTALHETRTASSSSMSLQTVCHRIVQGAVEAWSRSTGNQYRDDMSLVVHKML